jgi:galactonate dehydratase
VGAREPEEFAAAAKKVKALGIQALKWDPFGKAHMTLSRAEMDHAVAVVGAVREAVGPEMEILIECHGRFDLPTALRICEALEPYAPFWVEEPVIPDTMRALADVRSRVRVPIACGERLYTVQQVQDAIELRRHYARHVEEPQTLRIESSIAFFRKAAALAPCAIVSGSPHDDVAAAAALCGIADHVQLILGAGEYAFGKPSRTATSRRRTSSASRRRTASSSRIRPSAWRPGPRRACA